MRTDFLTRITGSFSSPAAENPTVVMMQAAYEHHDLDTCYLNCDISPASLADAVRGARAMRWMGFNCSLPHKIRVIEHLDAVADSAEIIGAVNCVVRRGDQLVGENTDGRGFLASLRTIVDPAGMALVVLGAGGAARAIAVEAALAGAASITVVNRDHGRGESLAGLVATRTPASARFHPWQGEYRVPESANILVNATSVGLARGVDTVLALDVTTLRSDVVVADVIPNPPFTSLLRDAKARGCRTLDGLGMLVNQGALAIEAWTGTTPDVTVMRRALELTL